jgi:hypothetical protein
MYNVTMRRFCVPIVAVEKKSAFYIQSVSVVLVIQHAQRMRCVILLSTSCPAVPHFFSNYLLNDTIFGNK